MKNRLIILSMIFIAFQTYAAERIISTAGNASEVVAELGKAAQLVGVDTTSLQPAQIMKDKPKIGYRRQLSAEGILSLNPDLILLAPDAGPDNVITQIQQAKVPILKLKDEQTLSGIRQDILAIGKALNAQTQAQTLITQIKQQEAQLNALKNQSGKGSALILINTGSQGNYALGKNTAGEHLLNILGLENAFSENGNKVISPEALAITPADVILIASRGDAEKAPVIEKANLPANNPLQLTKAAKNQCIYHINILDGLGFGWKTAAHTHQILKTLQPCLHH
ncbi:heme/hemin ABC transporter substrate-binding protein [Suttonella ornithocola]|nr:ABC transporter substrate-binding protein [Suttonella ornithocola]